MVSSTKLSRIEWYIDEKNPVGSLVGEFFFQVTALPSLSLWHPTPL